MIKFTPSAWRLVPYHFQYATRHHDFSQFQPKEVLLPLCNQSKRRYGFPLVTSHSWPWNKWNNHKKEAADGGGKDGNQGNTKVSRRHSPDGELQSYVRVCSPVDVCFLSPPGLEKLQKPTFVLQNQLPAKPACVFIQQAVLFLTLHRAEIGDSRSDWEH